MGMDSSSCFFTPLILSILSIILTMVPLFLINKLGRRSSSSKKLPPGSMGLPIIGQSLQLLRAMQNNTADKWLEDRIRRYGPISKLNLFRTPTVFINGPAANKFLMTSDGQTLSNQQPVSLGRIFGSHNIFALTGSDHKRVRAAMLSFLKPEMLKKFVPKMDSEVRHHIQTHWRNKRNVAAHPLLKSLTFDIISSLLFGLDRGPIRAELVRGFQAMIDGVWSIPINLPFTTLNRGLRASTRVRKMVRELIHKQRLALELGQASAHQDLITCLISNAGSCKDNNQEDVILQEEIEDNAMIILVAGYDTSAVLITFFIRLLAMDPVIYANVVHEQEEIGKSKAPEDPLTWEDVAKMKYTWKTALELLRSIPPILGSFRRVLRDIEYGGYLIPKGWQIFWAMSPTHMDERIFPDPWKIDPTRFDSQASIPPYCFVPFGGGSRICPGNEFTRLETLVVIHYLVTQFKWKLCCKDDTFSRYPMPNPPQGLPIQLEPKEAL